MVKDIPLVEEGVQIKEWHKYWVYIKSDWKYCD
jgi:hypothetical protein